MSTLPPVFTVAQLERDHLARPVVSTTVSRDGKVRKTVHYLIAPEGQAALRANQAERAAYFREHPDEARTAMLQAISDGRKERADE